MLATSAPLCTITGCRRHEPPRSEKLPTADIVASTDISSEESRQLAPFDPVYVNRLQEAFEMAMTDVCHLQTIPDAILNGT